MVGQPNGSIKPRPSVPVRLTMTCNWRCSARSAWTSYLLRCAVFQIFSNFNGSFQRCRFPATSRYAPGILPSAGCSVLQLQMGKLFKTTGRRYQKAEKCPCHQMRSAGCFLSPDGEPRFVFFKLITNLNSILQCHSSCRLFSPLREHIMATK